LNWLFFKKADVESKDRLKCSQCHVYLPDNYAEDQCQYCLGTKTRSVKVHKPEPVTTAEPIADLDLELHGAERKSRCPSHGLASSVFQTGADLPSCKKCGAVVPGLVSRYCINCSIMVIHYG